MLALTAVLLIAPVQQRTDTLVVRGNGNIPSSAVHELAVEWQASEAVGDIGDVQGMAVGPDGRVYVWDPNTPSLWVLNADGTGLKRIGRKGSGPGEYDRLNGLTVRPDGKLVVWDAGNSRLNVYKCGWIVQRELAHRDERAHVHAAGDRADCGYTQPRVDAVEHSRSGRP